ncbi:SpoIIE family protein phosphatase [Mariniblastus fucicola]|uniref:Phosphoserine phosphatase RsbU n=1 Tax=Mariniblastus fucicola TaxID=980251 RepID=A0A5B9PA58_9BACT|nr:SpoIIE family protein phosphatase [Mariniblastus fucicola]QEG23258.1 Phosphoserine phosphatase RsbU [Mariniblastus fucicola]
MAVLSSSDDSVIKKNYRLSTDPVIIGRHPECSIQIDDGSVSRHHAKVVSVEGAWFLEDLDSRNGTFLNGQAIQKQTRLFDGAIIKICDIAFNFHAGDGATRGDRPTLEERDYSKGLLPRRSSVVLSDDSESHVMSQLDPPSHQMIQTSKVSAEDKLNAITKITHALSEALGRDEMLTQILDFLFDLFSEADRGFIMLKDANGVLKPLGFKTRYAQDDEEIRISRTICQKVMDSKQPILSRDAGKDDRFDTSQSVFDFRIRSIMCAPLLNSKDESIGVVQLDSLRRSIVFKEEDVETLVTITMQASLAIQKADLFEQAQQNRELQADLELAHELQQRFLPQRPPEFQNYEFFSWYRPMQQVGGDYFDYVPLDKDRLGIVVADVVGHGIAAAMLMAKVSAEARFALATSSTPEAAVCMMNKSLSNMNLDRFVTLAVCLLDQRNDSLTIVNAGHMPPIIRRQDGTVETVATKESGVPIGILEDYQYESFTTSLHDGDVAILYTDGINEAMNESDEQLTSEAIVEELKHCPIKTPVGIGENLCTLVNQHMGFRQPIDDICMVCVGKNPS